jgi:hypothetical protein
LRYLSEETQHGAPPPDVGLVEVLTAPEGRFYDRFPGDEGWILELEAAEMEAAMEEEARRIREESASGGENVAPAQSI